MTLYDKIPGNLFSALISPNRVLYSKALFVLLDIFKHQLEITKNELISNITSALEDDIINADFSDEKLNDNANLLKNQF